MAIKITQSALGTTVDNDTPDPVITREVNRHLHGADITHNHGEHAQGSTLTVVRVMFALFMVSAVAGAFLADLTR